MTVKCSGSVYKIDVAGRMPALPVSSTLEIMQAVVFIIIGT